MTDRMPPPPGLTVVIGHAKEPSNGKMPPPGMKEMPQPDGKVSPEDAQVLRSDQHCIDCTMYDPTAGECSKVAGSLDPDDGCIKYFEKIGSDEPDEDDEGGASDQDEDDQEMQ